MGDKQIDIGRMPLEQLSQMREQLIEEDKFLSASYQQLQMATKKFEDSREALAEIKPEAVGSEIMVPITQSLYVRGTLANADSVLVDVGTGYFVDKSVPDADDYLKRKVNHLQENCGRLEVNIVEKRKNLNAVTQVMQLKIQMQQQAEREGKAKA